MQAAAGNYMQAAAGEYFANKQAQGEYFADSNLQGIGDYEQAGSMTQVRDTKRIDDGIRPDSNLDRLLTLADAAAGVNGITLDDVATESTWIPGGPLFAGTKRVHDTLDESEISAGILHEQGGNGSLS